MMLGLALPASMQCACRAVQSPCEAAFGPHASCLRLRCAGPHGRDGGRPRYAGQASRCAHGSRRLRQSGEVVAREGYGETDVFCASLILVRYLGLTSPPGGLFGAADRIPAFAAAQVHRPYALAFAAYRKRLIQDALGEAGAAHTLLAA